MKGTKKVSKNFIGFLVASVLIWLLITLSKEYTTTIAYPVSYIKIPQDKLLQSTPKEGIDIVIKASGFKIITTKFKKKPIVLTANSLNRKSVTKYYFLTKNQLINIQKQLLSDVQLQQIIQDTLFLDLGTLGSKKIAIKPILDINYHIGYDISKKINIKPDSIIISGPESIINKIKFIETTILKLDDVKSDFEEKVEILMPKNEKNINFNKESITISGVVEKFTEGSFKIPYTIVNLPENLELKTLSKTVEVVFVVGLSNFNKINKDSFIVACDYNNAEKNNLSYLVPKVISKPNFLKSVKVVPTIIDFLIQK